MYITRIDPEKPERSLIAQAARFLRGGGLVIYPTETAYALGCDPRNPEAVKRLFSVKRRDASKPLPLIAASKSQAGKFARSGIFARLLADAFWPGPLTLVLSPRSSITKFASGVVSRSGELALRVSPHPVAASLARALGRPIVATSANRSGFPTRYDIPSVLRDLGTLPDVVLDAGPLKKTLPSTLVRCQPSDVSCQIEILRRGPISAQDIARALEACR